MQFYRNCTAVALLIYGAVGLAAAQPAGQAAPAPPPGQTSYTIFVRGADVGREQVSLARSGSDWIVTSTGRFGDLTINRFELKYTADWQPIELRIEATQPQRKLQLLTSFGMTTAINEITQNGVTNAKTDQISARTVVLPNNFYAGYEVLAARLAGLKEGAELPVYVAPQAEVTLRVNSVKADALQTPTGSIAINHYDITIQNVGGTVNAVVTVDERSRFARLDIPSASLSVVRTDLAGVTVRSGVARNPTDSDVTIPASGFNIAGTLTMPKQVGRMRHPAIVLIAGSGPVDRDETVAGIPIFSQLAGALADRGFMVLRYDKRGVGQSGGRTETITLQDYANDLIAVVKWLERRDDVDRRRLAVVGHSEGGSVAMLAAGREKKIKSVVLMATMGTTGSELILEQQRHQLELMKLPEAERAEKIALQTRIQQAVVTEKGLDDLPADLRRQADTPWFKSLLVFDPAEAMKRVKQPILIIQGELDTQVRPHHADKLAELARGRKNAPPVEVVHLDGLNHLMVPATTGDVQEYPDLSEKAISAEVEKTIVDWLNK